MAYSVLIEHPDTHERRTYLLDDLVWRDDEYGTDLFWWTDGNFRCDCNRSDCFRRAAGEPDIDEVPCGNRYRVIHAILPDGKIIEIDGEEPPTNAS